MALRKENALLEVKNLKMYFPVTVGIFRRSKIADVKAVDDVSFEIKAGETLGLVGESGCGKTTIGLCILRIYRPTAGQVILEGEDITKLQEAKVRSLRRKMQLIFQDPNSSLDPRQSVGNIVGEPLKIHHHLNGARYRNRVAELFQTVGLDPSLSTRFPHELSGGQRQRIGIARALATEPSIIVCDEPVSALDVSIQAQIINLLEELQVKMGLTYLFISHDLSVVRHIGSRIAVMYLGRIVEITGWKELYNSPLHPYTQALLSAVPIPDPFVEEARKIKLLEGDVPSPMNPPSGCNFHTRCPIAIKECRDMPPPLRDMGCGHEVACIRV